MTNLIKMQCSLIILKILQAGAQVLTKHDFLAQKLERGGGRENV